MWVSENGALSSISGLSNLRQSNRMSFLNNTLLCEDDVDNLRSGLTYSVFEFTNYNNTGSCL
jgi:hypothetical protein